MKTCVYLRNLYPERIWCYTGTDSCKQQNSSVNTLHCIYFEYNKHNYFELGWTLRVYRPSFLGDVIFLSFCGSYKWASPTGTTNKWLAIVCCALMGDSGWTINLVEWRREIATGHQEEQVATAWGQPAGCKQTQCLTLWLIEQPTDCLKSAELIDCSPN
jgi:hypothetical protein